MGDDTKGGSFITHAEAARILGCGSSNVPKLIARGELRTKGRGRGPSLSRDAVEALAQRRAEDRESCRRRREERERARANHLPSGARRPPSGEGVWLTAVEAAAAIGISPQAVRKRCRNGTLPHATTGEGSRRTYWVRADHARLAAHVRATDGPEAVAIALDGLD